MGSRTHRGFARFRKLLLGSVLLAALDVASAALTVTEVVTPSLGTVFSGASSRQFILNTDETVSGANAGDYLFGAVSGQLELKKTAGPQDANIVADNFSTLGGVTVNAVPCRYHTGSQLSCDGAGIDVNVTATRTLYVGIDLNTSQMHNGGDSASVTYDITVTLI